MRSWIAEWEYVGGMEAVPDRAVGSEGDEVSFWGARHDRYAGRARINEVVLYATSANSRMVSLRTVSRSIRSARTS
jgi:hypothetical protein